MSGRGDRKEIIAILENMVSELSEREQLCFKLLFVDRLKPSEIEDILKRFDYRIIILNIFHCN